MKEKDAIPLREYFEEQIRRLEKQHEDFVQYWREERQRGLNEIRAKSEELEKRVAERAESSQRAIDKAEKDLDTRLQGMNEFREQIRDLTNTLATKSEVVLGSKEQGDRLRKLEDWSSNLQGKIATWLGFGGVVVAVLSVLLNYVIRKAFE